MHNSDYRKRKQARKSAYDLNIKKITVICAACSGSGYYDYGGRKCGSCRGTGLERRLPYTESERSVDRKTRKRIRLQHM